MKSTGIVRKIDGLGRVVLPIELKKYQPACIFCGEAKGVVAFEGRNICPACRKKIGSL